jgi:hypothetical protein
MSRRGGAIEVFGREFGRVVCMGSGSREAPAPGRAAGAGDC